MNPHTHFCCSCNCRYQCVEDICGFPDIYPCPAHDPDSQDYDAEREHSAEEVMGLSKWVGYDS